MPRNLTSVATCLSLLFIGGCAAQAGVPGDSAPIAARSVEAESGGESLVYTIPVVDAPPATDYANASYHLMAAELADTRGENARAAYEFLQVSKITGEAGAAARATRSALQAEDVELSRDAAQQWLTLEPTSLDAREVLFRLAVIAGDRPAAMEQARAMIAGAAGGPDDAFRQLAELLSQSPAPQSFSVDLISELAADYPEVAGAHYAVALVAFRDKNTLRAKEEAKAALNLAPGDQNVGMLLVAILLDQQDFEAADEIVTSLAQAASGDSSGTRISYARLLLDAGQRDRARRELETVVKSQPTHPGALYALGVIALNDGDNERARSYFEKVRKDPDRGADARFQLAAMAEREDNCAQAIALYETVDSGSQGLDAVIGRARCLAKLDRTDEALQSLEMVRAQFPPLASRMLGVQAQLLIDAGRRDEALALYDKALAERPDDLELLYGRSLAYDQAGEFEKSEADLRSMLQVDPDNTQALNTLGYMLTVRSTRYDEARSLIRKALAQEPNDPAIVDSLGWVEYKLGNLEQARELLSKAHDDARDPEIAAHLGEVLWQLGDRTAARKVWNDAQSLQPDHPVLTETMRRLDP